MDVGSGASLDITNAITIEAWFYRKGGNINGWTEDWIGKRSGTSKYMVSGTSSIKLYLSVDGTADTSATPSVPISNNVWTHLSYTYDSSTRTGMAYKNGVYYGQVVLSGKTSYTIDSFPAVSVKISPSSLYMVNGLIDDVRVYNYARTPAQIAWDYNRGKPKLHWKFDENTGATAYDYYKTKNGDLTGHSPDWTGSADQCKLNYCLDFTPANTDYVDVGDTGIGTNLYSASFWIYPDSIVSQNIMDFDNGARKITTDASGNLTANGWTSPTYYKNGVQTAAPVLTASTWQNITITTATAFAPSDVDFGRVAANYFDGRLDEIKFYAYPLTPAQVKQDANQGAGIRFGPAGGLP